MSKYGDFSGPYFPVIGLNTEIYGVRIQSKYGEMRTRKNSAFGHIMHSEGVSQACTMNCSRDIEFW